MVTSLPVILVLGTCLGFLSGIGVGGGSLLILWLTLVLELPQETARGINLLFFLPAAAVACCFRWQQGILKFRTILPAVLSGCIGAVLFSWIGMMADISLLQKGFGILLLFTGLRELCYKKKDRRE